MITCRPVLAILVGACSVFLGASTVPGMPTRASDDAHAAKAREMIRKGAAYLKTQQDAASGGWSVPAAPKGSDPGAKGEPHYPAITGLALSALLSDPSIKQDDTVIMSGLKYLMNHQQPDGGIYDRVLPSYNTSIVLSALAELDSPRARSLIPGAQEFLKSLQWSEDSKVDSSVAEAPKPVDKGHPFYGGVGYGRHGRPDNSNLATMLQALHDSGVSPDDASFKRALTFLQRTQMLDSVNDMPYADRSKQGGFVYATVPDAQSVDGRAGQSMAGEIEETMDDGTKVSRLRCYGSMTYAGFKSYLYAALARDDVRVKAAYDWIRRNYTVKENPGMGTEGVYYYYVTMARALAAWGSPTIDAIGTDGKTTTTHAWADELIDHLATLQNEDGSFKSVGKRWMEDKPVLITAYAMIALNEAAKSAEAKAVK
jgi:squalene-hopene/tetraprenyl-beta-curcumene cyclase